MSGVLRGSYCLMAACTRFHELDERLARWLLMTHDRAHANEFHLTQEFLSRMLGVSRISITNAVGLLQKNKVVRYSRGNITVLDRAGREASSCGCYAAEKATYERMNFVTLVKAVPGTLVQGGHHRSASGTPG